jgi:hypothetical protein
MSDTPRTDAAMEYDNGAVKMYYVDVSFAEQLERELSAANAEIARLRADLRSALIQRDDNYALAESRRREVIGVAAERDAAIAKIAAHNAVMDESCQAARKFHVCEEDHRDTAKCTTCPRRHRIEVDG